MEPEGKVTPLQIGGQPGQTAPGAARETGVIIVMVMSVRKCGLPNVMRKLTTNRVDSVRFSSDACNWSLWNISTSPGRRSKFNGGSSCSPPAISP